MNLGGSMFVRNAIKFDYCVQEALASLCAVCDEVVILDCQSEDDTLSILRESARLNPNLRVIEGIEWECADNYRRLAILSDLAKSHLNTEWIFSLQADEVIHEGSFQFIREAIRAGVYDSFMCRRINFFGDFNHYFGFDIPQEHKPCSDLIFRLAKKKYNASRDAESIEVDPRTCSGEYKDKIRIFHYGFVRDEAKQIDKVISMQSWFWGPGSSPDARAVSARDGGRKFDWREFKSAEVLRRFDGTHPAFAEKWIAGRRIKDHPVELSK